jgi:hypothetical protein
MFINRATKATVPPSFPPEKKKTVWQINERPKHPKRVCVSLMYFMATPASTFEIASAKPKEIPATMLLPGYDVIQNKATVKEKKT